jgi:protein TonB
MSLKPQTVSEASPEKGLGSLCGCLVDGDTEQRRRQRSIRRRSLAISIALQSTVLAALILVPLFGKAERISLMILTPMPPYSPYRNASNNADTQPPRHHGPKPLCHFCVPHNISPTIVMRDPTPGASESEETPFEGVGQNIPGGIDGAIPLSDPGRKGPRREDVETRVAQPRILHVTHLDPALLMHRVEPVYPPLAKQIHKEGRVELRAIIGTDGSIQSLQIVSGDPLFLLSAQEAVQQWHYKPTILNGQPVEIDTFITVVYTMQH